MYSKEEDLFSWCDTCESYHRVDNPTCKKKEKMNSKFFRKSVGELILQFYNSEKTQDIRIEFTDMKSMFERFLKVYREAQKNGFVCYQILRYCVDNSTYRDEHSTNWFLQVREVADQREGNVINRNNLFGLKILFDQYLFEKGEE